MLISTTQNIDIDLSWTLGGFRLWLFSCLLAITAVLFVNIFFFLVGL